MAAFCNGFVYEVGVLVSEENGPSLTIEGNKVEGFKWIATKVFGQLPSGVDIHASSVKELVESYLKGSGLIAEREKAREKHKEELLQGKAHWNEWRCQHPEVQPMLACADLHDTYDGYDFSYANLTQANLRGASFKKANFHQATLAAADLTDARLEGANFCRTDLYLTDFTRAHLNGANLQGVQLTKTILTGADVCNCKVYGLSAWDLKLDGTKQDNLIVRYQPSGSTAEEEVAVSGLDLAAFMYFALNNQNISRIIEASSKQWILILGRFTEGKDVLETLRDALKKQGYNPIIFDFERAKSRDLIETIILLAGMSAFVIVDISNPRSTPLELQAIASNYGVPIFPIMKEGSEPFGMFAGLRKFRWVFAPLTYQTPDDLRERVLIELITLAKEEARHLMEWKSSAEPK